MEKEEQRDDMTCVEMERRREDWPRNGRAKKGHEKELSSTARNGDGKAGSGVELMRVEME